MITLTTTRRSRALCGVAAAMLSATSSHVCADDSATAPRPLTAAEARARALLMETDGGTLTPPPEWGTLQKSQSLVSPSAPSEPAATPARPIRRGTDTFVVVMLAICGGSIMTLAAVALVSMRRRDEGPSSILPR